MSDHRKVGDARGWDCRKMSVEEATPKEAFEAGVAAGAGAKGK